MNVWSTIKLELYCNYSYMCKPTMRVCKLDDDMNIEEAKTIKNHMYIKCKRPDWCRKIFKGRTNRIPNFGCLSNPDGSGICPFLGYCEFDEDD